MLYPLITDNNCNVNKITLEVNNVYEKKFQNNHKISDTAGKVLGKNVPVKTSNYANYNDSNGDSDDIGTDIIKFCRTSYNVIYDYNKIGKRQLCIMSPFIKINKKPIIVRKNGNIEFTIDIDKNNMVFDKIIADIIDKISTENEKNIQCLKPMFMDIQCYPPITIHNMGIKSLSIELMSRKNKLNPNVNITPIHYHKSKSRGGGTVTIVNDDNNITLNNIITIMPMFKYGKYGLENVQTDHGDGDPNVICDKPNVVFDKNIYYEGKFILIFTVDISEYTFENSDYDKIACKISVKAKEIEIKYNVSYVKSVFDNDLTHITENRNIKTLIL